MQMKTWKPRVLWGAMPFILCAGAGNAVAVPVAGGSLDPLSIPKYVTPLVIPPVMDSAGTDAKGVVYDIAVRQFKQQILPGGIWATLNPAITNPLPATTVWSYGPDGDDTPTVAPSATSQFNYPAYTVENLRDAHVTVNWINDLVADPDACNGSLDPANDLACNFLPHLFAVDQTLHWANPAADCSTLEVRTDCHGTTDQPYTGPVPMISHVHGAHVGASGDGYTEAWWLPEASNISCVPREIDLVTGFPTGAPIRKPDTSIGEYVCEGTIANQLTNANGDVVYNTNNPLKAGQGAAKFGYPNDQPSTTLWYHDHSLGMTRTNVYAGPAGFWLIRDSLAVGGETGLVTDMVLPGPAPVAGDTVLELNAPSLVLGTLDKRSGIREIPIVIQGRSFNLDGSLFYPDNRAFFEGLNVAAVLDAEGNVITPAPVPQQFPGAPELQIFFDGHPLAIDPDDPSYVPPEVLASDIAPIWNPEAFFNTMVVNGVTWPQLEVAPAQYRFRLLNGANSRFLNLALIVTDALGNPATAIKTFYVRADDGTIEEDFVDVLEMDFYQIGAEQSLSPTVTAVSTGFATDLSTTTLLPNRKVKQTTKAPSKQQALLMGLAERADVIVDFRGLPDGTIITMTNTAPDAPFGGFPDVPADPATTGQVMRFVVNHALLGLSPTDELRDPVTNVVLNPLTAATYVENLVVEPADLDNFTVDVDLTTPARELALVEEESTLICADVDLAGNVVQLVDYLPGTGLAAGTCVSTIDGTTSPTALPFAPKAAVLGTVDANDGFDVTLWSDPIVTNVNADGSGTQTAEQWNLWNFTVDGHPIHVHLVKFKVLGRTAIGGGASVIDTATGAQAWENGWKDTVITYPGEVTSIAADFDINGLYVWHCHILEHEDNEMMVPMCVGVAGVDCPAQLF